jgi:hypothetical protein
MRIEMVAGIAALDVQVPEIVTGPDINIQVGGQPILKQRCG